jgi:hypothetical protein
MGVLTKFLALMLLLILISSLASDICAAEVEEGDKITIVTPGITARLCPEPMCGPDKHIRRIPEGTVLIVEHIENVNIGTIQVQWLEVKFGGNTGWISIFDTNEAQ